MVKLLLLLLLLLLSHFSCVWLCDPLDGSPPDSPVPGILQARTLEWVAISFSNAWKWKVKAFQAPPSMGFSRQEYWSGVPLPSLPQLSRASNFVSWVSLGLTLESGCSMMANRGQVFFPSWVPSGLTSSPLLVAAIADDCDVLCLLTWQEIFHFSVIICLTLEYTQNTFRITTSEPTKTYQVTFRISLAVKSALCKYVINLIYH